MQVTHSMLPFTYPMTPLLIDTPLVVIDPNQIQIRWDDFEPYYASFNTSKPTMSDFSCIYVAKAHPNSFDVSLLGRHEFSKHDPFHKYFFATHGILAVSVWIIFFFIWFNSSCKFGSKWHKTIANVFFYLLLIAELSGFYLCFHLNGTLSIPAMGISQFISTINGFTFKSFTMQRIYSILLLSIFNEILLVYAYFNERNLELAVLMAPFVVAELIRIVLVLYRIVFWTKQSHIQYCRSIMFHRNNIIYFSFLMFPGTTYTLSNDKYWLFRGITNVYVRIAIQNIFQYAFAIYQVWNFCTKSQRGFLQNFDLNVDFCKVEVLNFFLINDGERSEPQNVNRQRTARLCQMVHYEKTGAFRERQRDDVFTT
eukprot:872338_1